MTEKKYFLKKKTNFYILLPFLRRKKNFFKEKTKVGAKHIQSSAPEKSFLASYSPFPLKEKKKEKKKGSSNTESWRPPSWHGKEGAQNYSFFLT